MGLLLQLDIIFMLCAPEHPPKALGYYKEGGGA